jgi:hypothetical protein
VRYRAERIKGLTTANGCTTSRITRGALFITAAGALYIGGFVYDELGPQVYAIAIMVLASVPLLLKLNFWKQIFFRLPLLLLRVIAKYVLRIFGKNTLSFLTHRFNPVATQYLAIHRYVQDSRNAIVTWWYNAGRPTKSYLIVIFAPLAVTVAFILLVMELLRLKLLQIAIEKIMTMALQLIPNSTITRAGKRLDELRRASSDMEKTHTMQNNSSHSNGGNCG